MSGNITPKTALAGVMLAIELDAMQGKTIPRTELVGVVLAAEVAPMKNLSPVVTLVSCQK
jgi:hypothetical protein